MNREIIPVCSEARRRFTNAIWVQNTECWMFNLVVRTITFRSKSSFINIKLFSVETVQPGMEIMLQIQARFILTATVEVMSVLTEIFVVSKIYYRLQGPCYLIRDEHNPKIRVRKQRRDISKYSFVNRTLKLWKQLLAEALVTLLCKSRIFKKRVRKIIISKEKWYIFESWWRNFQSYS